MKNSKRNIINLIFSSFLVIGFIVCTYFFASLAQQISGFAGSVIQVVVLLIFGLLLFYATRVGEGVQIKRFSLPVLLLLDIPCLYIILAGLISALPLHDKLAPADGAFPIILTLAAVALGYGIPYTFLSGYEMQFDEEELASEDAAQPEEKIVPIAGGIAEELAEADEDEKTVSDNTEKTTDTEEAEEA